MISLADDTYTLWGISGAGEAGCRVASHYFATHPIDAVSDRVLLLNTARADLTNLLKTLEHDLLDGEAGDRLELARRQSCIFGDTAGAGNWFFNGEDTLIAEENWEEVKRNLSSVFGGTSDVVVHLCGLGGGTGNGCIPPIIHRLSEGQVKDVPDDVYQFAVGFWPFQDEGDHRHFNALMGLSRLIRYGDDGGINSDFLLLLGNDEMREIAEARGIEGRQYQAINKIAVEVINALISPGQESAQVIDARDYAVNSQRYQMQHFTAGVAWDVPEVYEFESALDKAAENVLLPIDPMTSISAYLILQVSPDKMEDPDFRPEAVGAAFRRWAEDNDLNADARMESVVPNPSLSGSYHAILLLGGFDLGPLLDRYEHLAEKQIDVLEQGFGSGESRAKDIQGYWDRLKEYVEVSDERREVLHK